MSDSAARFDLPAVTLKADGNPRLVGFELEFSGIDLDQAAMALKTSLGAESRSESVAEHELHVESVGDFNVELDWDYLKRKASADGQEVDESEWIERLGQIAAVLVPVEVVCPPLPIDRLDVLHRMVVALREAGAVGTEESLLAAYGVHINTEIPSLDADTLSSYIKAFALLQWWLVEAHDVDPTRKLSPYIELYPKAYLKAVLSQSGASMDLIFKDYLKHNASRNRALDLLPLLAEIDPDRVRSAVDDPKIRARPAFHYRLPNCHIERADWSLTPAWNRWCLVERLAHQPGDLDDLGATFHDMDRPVFGVSRNAWQKFIDQWLKDRGLV